MVALALQPETDKGKTVKETTISIIESALKSDPTVEKAVSEEVLALCKGVKLLDKPSFTPALTKRYIPRIIPREEVAGNLGVSKVRVDQLARAGLLVRVKARGMSRAMGYSEESVIALAEGRST